MDVRKWSWPGYLTFSKGTLQKTGPRDHQPTGAENGSEEQHEEPAEDKATGEPAPPNTEARVQVEVDRESLHEAMSDGISEPHGEETVEEENASVAELASQVTEATTAGADATLQSASQPLQDEDERESSPDTPVVRPPDFALPPSPSSSQGTLPVPPPAPSFRSFTLHFAHDDPLATVQRRVLYITVSGFLTSSCN